jgi:hypothetical protein
MKVLPTRHQEGSPEVNLGTVPGRSRGAVIGAVG